MQSASFEGACEVPFGQSGTLWDDAFFGTGGDVEGNRGLVGIAAAGEQRGERKRGRESGRNPAMKHDDSLRAACAMRAFWTASKKPSPSFAR